MWAKHPAFASRAHSKRRFLVGMCASLFAGLALAACNTDPVKQDTEQGRPKKTHTVDPPDTVMYGIHLGPYRQQRTALSHGQNLSEALQAFGVGPQRVEALRQAAKGKFELTEMRTDRALVMLTPKRDSAKLDYLIYEINPVSYVRFDLRTPDSVGVVVVRHEVALKTRTIGSVIDGSLFASIEAQNADPVLAIRMAAIYDWTLDFFKLQAGDYYKVCFEEQFVEGKRVGLGDIKGLQLHYHGRDYFAVRYVQNGKAAYYDEQGRPMRKAFLKAPLAYFHITSKFSMHRFHPVQQIWKPHLGVDYAAPTGTPIRSVGDGTVEAAGRQGGNGIYVKVNHGRGIATGYLHMSRLGRGMRPGVHVGQGQLIGYVGSTGLATGPHVCFRYWKNGTQINPVTMQTPEAAPLPKKELEGFMAKKTDVMAALQTIHIAEGGKGSPASLR